MIMQPQQNYQNQMTTKIYVGQLPLSFQQNNLRDIFSKLCQIKELKVIKGNSQGQFDRYCYAFMTIKGDQELAGSIIRKVSLDYPQWKMNIKNDGEKNVKPVQPTYQNKSYPNQGQNFGFGQNINYYNPPPQMYPIQPQPNSMQMYPPQQNLQNYYPSMQQTYPNIQYPNIDTTQKIVGEKNLRIMVRQVWLGGIPQMCQQSYMAQLMAEFGIVDNMQIFPKFAFIRFKLAQQATIAFERAQRMYQMFGNPTGFRIFFSDPARRANIVSNHYDYDRQSPFIPVLFLGFPPVTSANVDLDYMKGICQKYGTIVSYYMKKNNNTQTRSYILFTYDNLKSALKAKAELSRRRDILGDKRAQVTLLLDEQQTLRNHDLSYTEKMYQGDGKQPFGNPMKTTIQSSNNTINPNDKKKQIPNITSQQQGYGYPNQTQYPNLYNQYPGYPSQPQSTNSSYYPNPNMYYPNKNYQGEKREEGQRESVDRNSNDRSSQQRQYIPIMYPPTEYQLSMRKKQDNHLESMNLINQLITPSDKNSNLNNEKFREINSLPQMNNIKKPQNRKDSQIDASDIINKMLGISSPQEIPKQTAKDLKPGYGYQPQQKYLNSDEEQYHKRDQQPVWSGFLTWKGTKRVGVDGFNLDNNECNFSDYNVNISSLILSEQMMLKEKLNIMIIEPTNSISEAIFKQYKGLLEGKVGVAITGQYVIYILGKSARSDLIAKINDQELLLVMEKYNSIFLYIKEKLLPIETQQDKKKKAK